MTDLDSDFNYYRHFNRISDKLTIEEFEKYCDQSEVRKNHIKVMAYNIRRFFVNIDNFVSILQTTNYYPDVIILVETWLTVGDEKFANIEGYDSVHSVRQGLSGGVSIFYKNKLETEVLKNLCVISIHLESCAIKITVGGKVYYILGVYRPHSGSVDGFIRELSLFLSDVPILLRSNLIIIGDLNINLFRHESNQVQALNEFMRSNFMIPVIQHATRYAPQTDIEPSLIDHIWINFVTTDYKSGVILTDHTDHCPIYINVKSQVARTLTTKITFRDFSERCKEKFYRDLTNTDWNLESSEDINEKFEFFCNRIQLCYDRNFQTRTKSVSVKHINKPWITPAIQNSIKTKSKYFQLYKQNIITKERNDRFKNLLNQLIRKSKRKYFCEYFDSCFNNVKKTWGGIN